VRRSIELAEEQYDPNHCVQFLFEDDQLLPQVGDTIEHHGQPWTIAEIIRSVPLAPRADEARLRLQSVSAHTALERGGNFLDRGDVPSGLTGVVKIAAGLWRRSCPSVPSSRRSSTATRDPPE
jgi:hypothetical protein